MGRKTPAEIKIRVVQDYMNGITKSQIVAELQLNINTILAKEYNHKWIYRLMKSVNMKSVIRKKKKNYTPSTPQITAENVLNRQFQTDKPNQKWLTDVTEFKLTNGQKAYLSAILDLGDKSIVSYVLGNSNNNNLVFDTLPGCSRQS